MSRRRAFLAALLSLALAGAAVAQSLQASVVRQLQEQGWTGITVKNTLLGRIRIRAEKTVHQREVVINPRTGIILRDYIYLKTGEPAGLSDLLSGGISSGSRNGDDDFDDDDDDDGDDDDNSGSGGGGGSGSSGSGSGGNSGSGGSGSGGSSGSGGGGSSGSGGGGGNDDDD